MQFCPKCGNLMLPRRGDSGVMLVCTVCGYSMQGTSAAAGAYKLSVEVKHTEKEKTVVIETETPKVLPVTRDVICPKCGNGEAYYWIMQTRRADEPPTRFYRCTKCGHTWREYE